MEFQGRTGESHGEHRSVRRADVRNMNLGTQQIRTNCFY